jgi:RecJ-like exonuclease
MICPECNGNGFIKIPEKEINCPTCEGDGELSDTPSSKHYLLVVNRLAKMRIGVTNTMQQLLSSWRRIFNE